MIRPEPDLDLFFKLRSDRNRIRFFFQINIRPEPDPDLFFKLISGRIRNRILDPVDHYFSFQKTTSWSVNKSLRTWIGVFLRFSELTMQKIVLFSKKIFMCTNNMETLQCFNNESIFYNLGLWFDK